MLQKICKETILPRLLNYIKARFRFNKHILKNYWYSINLNFIYFIKWCENLFLKTYHKSTCRTHGQQLNTMGYTRAYMGPLETAHRYGIHWRINGTARNGSSLWDTLAHRWEHSKRLINTGYTKAYMGPLETAHRYGIHWGIDGTDRNGSSLWDTLEHRWDRSKRLNTMGYTRA
jgi:hypothetical protein